MDDIFESKPFVFKEEALTYILDSLTEPNNDDIMRTNEEKPEIETFQLQIVCKYAEDLAIEKGLKEITKGDLGDLKLIFENQYKNIITKLPGAKRLPAQIMMEEKLIVEKTRVSMPEISLLKEVKEIGLTRELIDYLINTHIIRRDQSGSVEISHDTLVEPILKSKKEREGKEELARIEAERKEELRKQKEKEDKEKLELENTRERLRIVEDLVRQANEAKARAEKAEKMANEQREKAEKALKEIIEFHKMSVGNKYQGGVIFYSDNQRKHGLIAAEQDLEGQFFWKEAKKACEDYSVTFDNVIYNDWHLPTKDELALLYLNRNIVGGLANSGYWSSTEDRSFKEDAWSQGFLNGNQGSNDKSYKFRVRPVRAY
jgi:hypothetical protein